MKCIIVLDLNASTWEVLDVSFPDCPPSPVRYGDISFKDPLQIIKTCGPVEIRSTKTGAKGIGVAIIVKEL